MRTYLSPITEDLPLLEWQVAGAYLTGKSVLAVEFYPVGGHISCMVTFRSLHSHAR